MMDAEKIRRTHPLATLSGLRLFIALMVAEGAVCPKCGWGTRATSKRWARCKKCGERVERREINLCGKLAGEDGR